MSELPNAYTDDDGITYYRASSLGRCVRALAAQQAGFEPLAYPEKLEGIFHEGHLHESDIIERLIKDGWAVEGSQDEITIMVTPAMGVRGHIDGICHNPQRIVECKAFGQSTFDKWKKSTVQQFFADNLGYGYQLSAYMYGSGYLEALYAVKNRNTGELLWREVAEPPVSLGALKKRVLQIALAARKYLETGQWPDCPARPDFPCPFYYLHDDREQSSDFGPDKEIEALAEAYDKARDRAEAAEKVQKDCRALMIQALGDRSKVSSGPWTVSYATQKRKTIDIKAAREALDLSQFEVVKEVRALQVRKKGSGNEKQ